MRSRSSSAEWLAQSRLHRQEAPEYSALDCWRKAPTLIREQGPIYAEGPMMTIQLASPAWPDSQKSGN